MQILSQTGISSSDWVPAMPMPETWIAFLAPDFGSGPVGIWGVSEWTGISFPLFLPQINNIFFQSIQTKKILGPQFYQIFKRANTNSFKISQK